MDRYVELATRSPGSEIAALGITRVLLKRDRVDDARAVLAPLASKPNPSAGVARAMGQIDLVSGDFSKAERWFERPEVAGSNDYDTLSAAAVAFAVQGKPTPAARFMARYDARTDHFARMYDLQVRLAVNPNDMAKREELRQLCLPESSPDASSAGGAPATAPAADSGPQDGEDSPKSGPELYAHYCSACHGDNGNGNGLAARDLFPKPRDFRTGRFRLVSTRNAVATLEDVERVLKLGMPGTSMRSYKELSDAQRKLLAEEVLRLNREGVREHFISVLKEEDEEVDQDEVAEVVELSTTPGELVSVPEIGPAGAEAVRRGRQIYVAQGCEKCHGDDGVGAADASLFDDAGLEVRPRDLVHEPFKGGHEPESIYLRLAVGMPGTFHPASSTLDQQQLVDLTQYCRSLSQEPKRLLTNSQQDLLSKPRAYLAAFSKSAQPKK